MGLDLNLPDQFRGIDLQCPGQVEEGLQRGALPAPFKETDVGSVMPLSKPRASWDNPRP